METRRRPYRWLAEYYDDIFNFHLKWFEKARKDILGPILRDAKSGCDLGCGTGNTAIALAVRGIQMNAVDLSPVMCKIVREKAKLAGLKIRVIRADMRDFRVPEPVDLIVSEADAINHIPEKPDLWKVAQSAARALRPGGHFFFDLNTRRAFLEAWRNTWLMERPGVLVVMHGNCDPSGQRAWTEAEWFLQEGKLWRREYERVDEICWSTAEVRRALREAGFDRIKAVDAVKYIGKDTYTGPGYRTFYVARKQP